jgi:hypothetical protein
MTLDGVVVILIWAVAILGIVVAWHMFAWNDE